jgi:hypothetical protein
MDTESDHNELRRKLAEIVQTGDPAEREIWGAIQRFVNGQAKASGSRHRALNIVRNLLRANLRYKGGAHRLESLGRNKSSLLRAPDLIVETGQLARTDINYASLRKECLYAIKNWPGCESVAAIQLVRNGSRAGFSIKVTLPGEAELITVERATACVEREMRRRYRLAD